jgi:hypothetical protein
MDIRSLVHEFTNRLQSLVQDQVVTRARAVVDSTLGNGGGRQTTLSGKTRKKAPRQLCPVPGCKNTAAPVYGMVCAKHKDVSKAKIKKYRAARRVRKARLQAEPNRRATKRG